VQLNLLFVHFKSAWLYETIISLLAAPLRRSIPVVGPKTSPIPHEDAGFRCTASQIRASIAILPRRIPTRLSTFLYLLDLLEGIPTTSQRPKQDLSTKTSSQQARSAYSQLRPRISIRSDFGIDRGLCLIFQQDPLATRRQLLTALCRISSNSGSFSDLVRSILNTLAESKRNLLEW
jgi:hypothetical protein